MDFSEFQAQSQSPQPAYLLLTDQDYLRKRVYEHCLNQVDAATRAFDWSVFDLARDSPTDLIEAARTLPWVSPRRWIYVRNADLAADQLVTYLKDPCSRTVLMLDVGKIPSSWPALPVIQMASGTNVLRWVMAKVKKEGYAIEPGAGQALVELVGEDFQALEGELEKQFLCQLESRKITLDSVMMMVFQVREYEIFALIDALAGGRCAEALRVLNQLYDAGVSAPQLVSMLYWNFRRLLVARERLDQGESFPSILRRLKIWSYKGKEEQVRRYPYPFLVKTLMQLREADRLFKTTNTDARVHLERLAVDTCSGRSL